MGDGEDAAPAAPDNAEHTTDTTDTTSTDEPTAALAQKPKRKRWKVALVWTAAVLVFLSGGAVIAGFTLVNRYENKVDRQDILPAQVRPKEPTQWDSGPLNFLVLGSDSRGEDALGSDDPGGARSDTIMIVHIAADHRSAYVVSIPRDSYVDVPAVPGKWRGGKNKINAAFQYGGAKLAAETVYNLTKVPLDTAMIIDFAGIHSMVGAVGTVHVCIPFSMRSIHTKRKWAKGCHDMGPEETEDFMRQRKSVPGGDFGRIQNQQLVVKGLADKITSQGTDDQPAQARRTHQHRRRVGHGRPGHQRPRPRAGAAQHLTVGDQVRHRALRRHREERRGRLGDPGHAPRRGAVRGAAPGPDGSPGSRRTLRSARPADRTSRRRGREWTDCATAAGSSTEPLIESYATKYAGRPCTEA